jgi:hypothetical protein
MKEENYNIQLPDLPPLLSKDHIWQQYLENRSELEIARLQGQIRMIDQKCKELTLKKRYESRLGGRY